MTVRVFRYQSGIKELLRELRGADRSTGRRESYWKSGGQQDKRPRHVCAAKRLSAHQFLQHSTRMAPCRRVANRIKALSI
jgi:hypothetical protein